MVLVVAEYEVLMGEVPSAPRRPHRRCLCWGWGGADGARLRFSRRVAPRALPEPRPPTVTLADEKAPRPVVPGAALHLGRLLPGRCRRFPGLVRPQRFSGPKPVCALPRRLVEFPRWHRRRAGLRVALVPALVADRERRPAFGLAAQLPAVGARVDALRQRFLACHRRRSRGSRAGGAGRQCFRRVVPPCLAGAAARPARLGASGGWRGGVKLASGVATTLRTERPSRILTQLRARLLREPRASLDAVWPLG